MIEEGWLPESLTRRTRLGGDLCTPRPGWPASPRNVAGFSSEWWPVSNRNPGRLHVGIPGRNASESASGPRQTDRDIVRRNQEVGRGGATSPRARAISGFRGDIKRGSALEIDMVAGHATSSISVEERRPSDGPLSGSPALAVSAAADLLSARSERCIHRSAKASHFGLFVASAILWQLSAKRRSSAAVIISTRSDWPLQQPPERIARSFPRRGNSAIVHSGP
jgi:hypothetical protein